VPLVAPQIRLLPLVDVFDTKAGVPPPANINVRVQAV
jgi:hypothetical protein